MESQAPPRKHRDRDDETLGGRDPAAPPFPKAASPSAPPVAAQSAVQPAPQAAPEPARPLALESAPPAPPPATPPAAHHDDTVDPSRLPRIRWWLVLPAVALAAFAFHRLYQSSAGPRLEKAKALEAATAAYDPRPTVE